VRERAMRGREEMFVLIAEASHLPRVGQSLSRRAEIQG
jgi:hypothetical protein